MKIAREKLREVLSSADEIRKLVIVYQTRGTPAKAVHTLPSTAEAIIFVAETLRFSDEELLRAIQGRP